jgi:hypothetical protein
VNGCAACSHEAPAEAVNDCVQDGLTSNFAISHLRIVQGQLQYRERQGLLHEFAGRPHSSTENATTMPLRRLQKLNAAVVSPV